MNYIQKEDLRVGQTVHIAHPVYGIDTVKVMGLPYQSSRTYDFLFFDTDDVMGVRSIDDSGLHCKSYNYRRTFLNYDDAVEYCYSMIDDEGFKKQHKDHLSFCAYMDTLDDLDYEELLK